MSRGRYCRAFTSRYPFGEGTDLVYPAHSKTPRTMPTADAGLLESCNRFRTIEQHAAAWRQTSGEPESRLVEKLQRFAEEGLLISDEQFATHCASTARTESEPPPIATIGTTTRNRPELLQRGFSSFFANANRYGRTLDFVVVDDAITGDEKSATKQALKALVREHGAPIRYADRDDRQSFADELAAAADVPAEVVRFALLGDAATTITTGAARNSLLIDTAGDLFLMVDDDSVCRVAPCPRAEAGLALDARANPTELWFYRDRDAMLRDTRFEELDPLALHETILGRQLGDCLPPADRDADLDLTYTTADFAHRLWSNGGRVLTTSGGVVGDSGMGSTTYLTLSPESQERLVRSEQDYAAAVGNRQILRAPHRTTITRGTFCAGASLGLDNRVLLPPFIPVQRNSDGLFARTLLRCFRDGYKGYLPWAVLHDPLPPRTQSPEGAEADAARIRLTHIVRALIVPPAFTYSGDPAVDLRRVGEDLAEIASQRPGDFQHTIKPLVVKSAAVYLAGIEQAMKTAPGPEFYLRRQKDHWLRLSQALASEQYFVPRDLGDGSAEEILGTTQRLVRQFGEVLRSWPAMVEAARGLRARGVRLGKTVSPSE